MAYLCFRERHRNIFRNRWERFVHNRALAKVTTEKELSKYPSEAKGTNGTDRDEAGLRSSPTKASDRAGPAKIPTEEERIPGALTKAWFAGIGLFFHGRPIPAHYLV